MSDAFQMPFVPALDENGDTVPGAQLYFFLAGTTTPEPVYLDEQGTTLAPHPVIANSSGRFPPLWSSGNKYKVVLRKASDIILDEIDNYAFTGVLGSVTNAGGTEEQFLEVDLTDGGVENSEMVAAYNPPGITSTSPEWRDFQTTTDQFNYDKGVQPQFYHDQPLSQFDDYLDDIKRFNSLYAQIQSYSAGPSSNNGLLKIRIMKGKHRIWGAGQLTGLNAGVSIEGEGVALNVAQSASFEASPRGDTWSRATINVENELPEDIVVGMMYQSGEILSEDTDHSASSSAAIVTDDLAFLNTGFALVEISPDRLSFKVDVPHVGSSTTRLVGGNILNTGTGATGFPAGRITFALSQIAFTGGFDGRADEAWLRPQYGSLVEYADIAFVETTDPTITRSNGFAPDRKAVFAANIADVMLRQNVGFAGAEGHVLRIAKLVRLTANLSHFGGAGLSTRAGRSAYAQLVCFADFTRCSFGNSLTYSLLAAGLVLVSAQNCIAVGGTFAVQAITGAHINFQNSLIYGAAAGIFVGTNSSVTVDAGTVIENCGYSWQVRDTSKLVKLSEPVVINTGAAIDNTTQNPVFGNDVLIDKTNPKLTFMHGSLGSYIQGSLGAFDVRTDSSARDVTFSVDGDTTPRFKMDMGTNQLMIDDVPVLGAPGAAIADADGTLADVNAKLNLILARMRAATPTIQT